METATLTVKNADNASGAEPRAQYRVRGYLAESDDKATLSGPVAIDDVEYDAKSEPETLQTTSGAPYNKITLTRKDDSIPTHGKLFRARTYGELDKLSVSILLTLGQGPDKEDMRIVGFLHDKKRDGTPYKSPISILMQSTPRPDTAAPDTVAPNAESPF